MLSWEKAKPGLISQREDMTGEEEGDFTESFVSYPDCVRAPSVAGLNSYLKPNQTGWRFGSGGVERGGWGLDKLNFHTDKEEVGEKTFEAR